MRAAHGIAAPIALLMAGCVNFAPPHETPSLPTPSEYPIADLPSYDRFATEFGLRAYFADPRLLALIETALSNNRDLAVAVARIDEARGLYRVQDSARLPAIDGSGSATRSRTPVGSGAVGASPAPSAVVGNDYGVTVSVSAFELDFWGRVSNLSEAARARYLSTVAAQRAFRLSLIGDVSAGYFTLREASERIAIAQQTLGSRREELRIAQLRLDAGVTSALDYNQAQALLTQAETELAALQLSRAQAENQLGFLVGGAMPSDLPPALPLDSQRLDHSIRAGSPSTLLLIRPDIIAAEYELIAARANIGAARAAFFPSISLTGSAGFASSELGDLLGEDGLRWSFGPSISLPIFDWGRRQGDLTVARAREVIEVAEYERTVQNAFREVSDALAQRQWLAEQADAQEQNIVAYARIARLARLRYDEGVAEYLEVLDAERNLFSARQGLISLQAQRAAAFVSLYLALGGGQLDLESSPSTVGDAAQQLP